MAIIQSGATTDILTVSPTFKAARTEAKPFDYGAFGHYSWGGSTGLLPAALGANSEIFQFRYSGVNLAVIYKIMISAAVSTTFFAAGVPVQLDVIKSTAWTVQGTGGTGITVGTANKRRSTMASSGMVAGDMRVATTAALGAGTKTLDANSLAAVMAAGPTASPGTIFSPFYIYQSDVGDTEHPLIMSQNEGFSIRSVAVPATGTWMVSLKIVWAETASY